MLYAASHPAWHTVYNSSHLALFWVFYSCISVQSQNRPTSIKGYLVIHSICMAQIKGKNSIWILYDISDVLNMFGRLFFSSTRGHSVSTNHEPPSFFLCVTLNALFSSINVFVTWAANWYFPSKQKMYIT